MKETSRRYGFRHKYYLISTILILLLFLPSLALAIPMRYEIHLEFEDKTESKGHFWFDYETEHFSEWNIETKSSTGEAYTYSSDDECEHPQEISGCFEYASETFINRAWLDFYQPCWEHLCEYQRRLRLILETEIIPQPSYIKILGIRHDFPSYEAYTEVISVKRRVLFGGIFNTSLKVPGPTTLILLATGLIVIGCWNKRKAFANQLAC